jgi:tRNA-splicing endonuclease subunit Sen54
MPLPPPRQRHRPANAAGNKQEPAAAATAINATTTPPAATIITATTPEKSWKQKWLSWLFPQEQSPPPPPPPAPARKVNPFVALKAGKKTVVIAVVDAGNIGFYRFSEGAFDEWPMQ